MTRTGIMVVLLFTAFAGAACVEDVGSMLVVHNASLNDTCELDAEVGGNFLPKGTLDIMLTNKYVMFPTIQSQLQSSKNVKIEAAAGGGTGDFRDTLNEGNAITLSGATVSFTTPPNVTFALPQNVFIPVSGTIFPGSATTTALEVLSVDIGNVVRRAPEFFDANEEAFKRRSVVTVLVTVKFDGTTTSGTDVSSNEFTFPMDICAGCLLIHPPGTLFIDDDNSLTCDVSKAPAEEGVGGATLDFDTPCILGQDTAVDCRLCRTLAPDELAADALCDP